MDCNSNNISFGPRDKEFVDIELEVLCPLTYPLSYLTGLYRAAFRTGSLHVLFLENIWQQKR